MTIKVMVNGLSGKMATETTKAVLENSSKFSLVKFSLSSGNVQGAYPFSNGQMIFTVKPNEREGNIPQIKEAGNFISVDYTIPDAVNSNAEFYCKQELPFIMGTTGGDRKKLEKTVLNSQIPAVIAPNMALPIVGFMDFMNNYAEEKPNTLQGSTLEIYESHQPTKKDTSGTAKEMVEYFNKLGIPFVKDQIVKLRDGVDYDRIGIPEEYREGHGWHEYTIRGENLELFKLALMEFLLKSEVFSDYLPLEKKSGIFSKRRLFEKGFNVQGGLYRVSQDNTVGFALEEDRNAIRFIHNVNGRKVYALGTLEAIRYLNDKVESGKKGRVYSMIDVLKAK